MRFATVFALFVSFVLSVSFGWAQVVQLALDGQAAKNVTVRVQVPAHPRALVVYTHGFLDNHRNHERLFGALLAKGYAVAGWDLIGHGTSFGMRGYVESFDDYVRALELVRAHAVAQVPPGTPVYLVAHSLGALVQIRDVELHGAGVAGSAYLAPFLEAKLTPVRRFLNSLSGLMDHIFPKLESPHGVTNLMMFRTPEILKERAHDPYFFTKITVHLFRQMQAGIAGAFRDVARITGPVLFLVAGDEQVVVRAATDRFYALIPAADRQYTAYEDARHELHSDIGREAVLARLLGWLDERVKTQAFDALHGRD